MSENKPYETKFWKKSWDPGLKDLNPSSWDLSFSKALRKSFDEDPDKIALAFLGTEMTFGELDLYSNQFANMLQENEFRKGDIVGINLPNIPEYVIALIGAHKIGCVVSGVSPLLSAIQMHYQLKDLGAKDKKVALVTLDAIFESHVMKIAKDLTQLEMIITTSVAGFLPKFKQILGKLFKKIPTGKVSPIEGKKVLDFHKEVLENYSTNLPEVEVTPDDLAYIQYTGGTTGPPKGAMLTHRNAVADLVIVQEWLQWERGDYMALSGFPFFHIAGLFFCENCLYLGWGQVLIPNPRDSDNICKELEKYKPTIVANVPSLFQILMKNPKFSELDHSNLSVVISAASPFPKESQIELENIVGAGKLLEVYGMTETSPLTTMNPSKGEKKLGSIGLPILNTDLKLVDPETNKPVPLGDAGEILVRGPQVMKGYYNKPEETKIAIDNEKFMHTGDVAIMDDEGYLRIVDRTKDMINVSGFKVFSTKVEDILSRHPAIDQIALIGIDNPKRPGSEIVKGFVKIDPNYEYDGDKKALEEEITEFAKENCSPYEVPKILEFTEELPLTAVGKIDKKVLRKEE
jgi:long-chain acyl-CoA synthetase